MATFVSIEATELLPRAGRPPRLTARPSWPMSSTAKIWPRDWRPTAYLPTACTQVRFPVCSISSIKVEYLELNHSRLEWKSSLLLLNQAMSMQTSGIVYTEIGRNLDSSVNNSVTRAMSRAMFWSPLQGAQSTIYCCVEESIKVFLITQDQQKL